MTSSGKKQNKANRSDATLARLPDDEDDDDIPPLDDTFWSRAQMGSPLKKKLISLRLDNDVVAWFKKQGPSYQTRMNQVLRTYMEFCEREKVLNEQE